LWGAFFELFGDAFGDGVGVEVRLFDLEDLDGDGAAGHELELFLEAIDLGAFGADDEAGSGGLDDDGELGACALDEDVGDGGEGRRAVEAFVDEFADAEVFDEEFAVERFGCVPAAFPGFCDAAAVSVWVDFLAHVRRLPRR